MEYPLSFWLLAIIGVLITGISKSGFAGGIGVIAVPLLSLSVSPMQAAAIMLPLLLIMDYFSMRIWWGKQDAVILKLLIPPALLGIVVGYLLFDHLNETSLKLQLGILSLVFAIWGLTKGIKLRIFKTNTAGRFFASIAGFTSFIAHAGGPPFNAYMIPLKLPKEAYLATSVIFFGIINLVKVLPYAMLNQLSFSNLQVAILLIPIAWIGVKLGVIIQKYLNDDLFYKIILWMLMGIGIKLIVG